MENANSKEYLNKILTSVVENIRKTGTPSVQLTQTPAQPLSRALSEEWDDMMADADEDENADKRVTQRQRDQQIANDAEFSDSEDEEYRESLGVRAQPGRPRRRNIMDFQNPNAAPDDVMDGADSPDAVRGLNGESGRATNQASPAPVSRASSAKPPATNGTRSRTHSPVHPAEDGDVEMQEADDEEDGEDDASPAQDNGHDVADSTHQSTESGSPMGVVTPPESPADAEPAPAAATPIQAEAEAPAAKTEDVEMADTDEKAAPEPEKVAEQKEEGLKEREEEDVRAEKKTEITAKDEQMDE
jgi:histone deacetylase 1/2